MTLAPSISRGTCGPLGPTNLSCLSETRNPRTGNARRPGRGSALRFGYARKRLAGAATSERSRVGTNEKRLRRIGLGPPKSALAALGAGSGPKATSVPSRCRRLLRPFDAWAASCYHTRAEAGWPRGALTVCLRAIRSHTRGAIGRLRPCGMLWHRHFFLPMKRSPVETLP